MIQYIYRLYSIKSYYKTMAIIPCYTIHPCCLSILYIVNPIPQIRLSRFCIITSLFSISVSLFLFGMTINGILHRCKKKDIWLFVTTWMGHEGTMLSVISQRKTSTYDFTCMWNLKENKTNTESQIQRIYRWLPEGKRGQGMENRIKGWRGTDV